MSKNNCKHQSRRSKYSQKINNIYEILRIMNNNLMTDKLKISVNSDETQLVFKVLLSNDKIGTARLPLKLDCNDGSSLPSISLPKPIIGINYEPSPSNYNSLPPPAIYYDTDFSNVDFRGLWSPTDNNSNVPGRDDINVINQMHFNVVKMYNWNPLRNHKSFLDYCDSNNIKVIVPISNYFIENFSTQQDNILKIINQANHPAVIAFAIGNEIDISFAPVIANIVKLVNGIRLCCAPVKITDFPSIPQAIFQAYGDTMSNFSRVFFQAVNVYPPPNDAVNQATVNLNKMINQKWPSSIFHSQPLLISEYGWNSSVSEIDQSNSIQKQITFIKQSAMDPSKPLFLGGILFEFTDELWKPDQGNGFDGQDYGLFKLSDKFTIGTTVGNLQFPINVLIPKPIVTFFGDIVIKFK